MARDNSVYTPDGPGPLTLKQAQAIRDDANSRMKHAYEQALTEYEHAVRMNGATLIGMRPEPPAYVTTSGLLKKYGRLDPHTPTQHEQNEARRRAKKIAKSRMH